MTAETQTSLDLDTETEAARVLGVCPGTLKAARLNRLKSNPLRTLPYVKIGRCVRYRKSDISKWIEENLIHGASHDTE
mgnify:CR=1 FL=1